MNKSRSSADWQKDAHVGGHNAAWVDHLYEQWLGDERSVAPEWARYFASLPVNGSVPETLRAPFVVSNSNVVDVSHASLRRQYHGLSSGVERSDEQLPLHANLKSLVDAYRHHGHKVAQLDPLDLEQHPPHPALDHRYHRFGEQDLDVRFDVGDFLQVDAGKLPLREIIALLDEVYCGSIGVEVMYMPRSVEREWLLRRVEGTRGAWNFSVDKQKRILERLIAAEGLEQYLASHYPGTKRFGLEGGEVLIPALDNIISLARSMGALEMVLGMAHRGRLNVLVNILGKNPGDLFQEFEGTNIPEGAGDVKYHQGFSSNISTDDGELHLALAPNPSHLEIISPVVQGSARARQDRRKDKDGLQVLPVLIHGDAAFSAQGVVLESFQMSNTRAHRIGGTVHIVLNNQIGFTTSSKSDARSTDYCTDVAKMLGVPVLHVNADDPEAVVFVTQLMLEYRQRFRKDVVIDLVCYRRLGHNEADEPSLTQPLMYQKIKQHPSVCKQYAERLVEQQCITPQDAEKMRLDYHSALKQGWHVVKSLVREPDKSMFVDWTPHLDRDWHEPCDTHVALRGLKTLGKKISTLPKGFCAHRIVDKLLATRRKQFAGKIPLDWGCAETIAYATLLAEGYRVRLVGQDSRRGTFAHRHALVCDQDTGAEYIPLKRVSTPDAFMLYDSLLSELGVLGFEYGYAATAPNVLVVWEAQFGDFCNGAQVIIDQFLSSGEHKWGRLCGLSLFLPHGYEGQGAEHSSARIERFLQLCANHNMQLCVPSVPAQIFHLLRRQLLRPLRKPLVVMTPKSLLRHPDAVSSLDDLTHGAFVPVFSDVRGESAYDAERMILCSGKVYYDLVAGRARHGKEKVAIMRLEQLYPFPEEELCRAISAYKHLGRIVWCQEEPRNQGAWYNIRHRIHRAIEVLDMHVELSYAGRPASAAAAVGLMRLHVKEQERLVAEALGLGV